MKNLNIFIFKDSTYNTFKYILDNNLKKKINKQLLLYYIISVTLDHSIQIKIKCRDHRDKILVLLSYRYKY